MSGRPLPHTPPSFRVSISDPLLRAQQELLAVSKVASGSSPPETTSTHQSSVEISAVSVPLGLPAGGTDLTGLV